MATFVTVAVVLAMIGLGVLLIHLLNAQHGERIAAFRYGRPQSTAPARHRARGEGDR